MPDLPIVHAVFGESASGHLKWALNLPWSSIIVLNDDLSVGSLDRTDGESRAKWWHEQVGVRLVPVTQTDRFWAEVASPANRIVAWVSRRSAREYACLLALVSEREDRPLDIVDVTDVQFLGSDGKPDPAMSFGIGGAPVDQTADLKLVERAAPLSASVASSYRQTWSRLKQENAPLRVVDGGELVSVAITHFDPMLASLATPEWQTTDEIIQAFHNSALAAGFKPSGDLFARSRVVAMVKSGILEGKGDFAEHEWPKMRAESWVRIPNKRDVGP